jgi:hypothetical protein
MIRARKTSGWLLVLAFTMRLSSLCWLEVALIATGAGISARYLRNHSIQHYTSTAFRTAVGQCLREEWLSPEYVAKTQRNPLTKLNKVVL